MRIRKPRSLAQQEASRRNGAKSRGPKTQIGKSNTLGPHAKTIVIPSEDSARFTALLNSLRAELQPASALEEILVEDLATSRRRQRRFLNMETALIARRLTDLNPAPPTLSITSTAANSISPASSIAPPRPAPHPQG